MNLNKIQLIGDIATEPVARKLPSGKSVTAFRLLTNTSAPQVKDAQFHDRSEFHQVVSYGRLAEVAAKYLKKGDRIYLDGSLTYRTWQGQGDAKRSRTEIVMQNLIMLGSAKKSKREPKNDDVVAEEVGEG